MATKWMTQLLKKDGAVKWDYNPFSNVLRTGSPSFDYIYGKTQGLPFGYSEVLWGPPKGGKSLAVYMKIGALHQSDPDAIAILYSTEMRAELQLTPLMLRQHGIDPDRLVIYQTAAPEEVFDHIKKDVQAMCQEGAPIRYIAIDSITNIMGRRAQNADTILTQQIGDDAKTIQDGLKSVQMVIRRHRIALSLVAQARAELDPLEQMRGNKLKMAGAWALQHFAEYFIFVEHNKSKDGKVDELEQSFENENKKDLMDHAEKTAHKIRVTLKGNSAGVAGRVGQFTLDYHQGLKNKHEEAVLLAIGQGVVQRPNNTMYVMPDFPEKGTSASYKGYKNFVMAVRDNPMLSDEIIKRVRLMDIEAMENGTHVPSGVAETSADEAESQLTVDPGAE